MRLWRRDSYGSTGHPRAARDRVWRIGQPGVDVPVEAAKTCAQLELLAGFAARVSIPYSMDAGGLPCRG